MPKPLTIAIDAREMTEPRDGKSRTVSELVRALAAIDQVNRYRCYVWARPAGSFPSNVEFVVLPKTIPGGRLVWVANDLRRSGADVFFSPTGYHPVLLSPVPAVLMIHDLAVLVESRAKPSMKTALMERLGLPFATRRASAIIAASDSTKRDVERLFPHTRGKVSVVLQAAFPSPPERTSKKVLAARYHLPEQFTLFVGTLEPRKNVDGLIRAYAALNPALRNSCPLVLVGRRGWNVGVFMAELERAKAEGWLLELGSVPNADLPGLYELATLFAYPSWYEGFGLPPLEAMGAGIAVVTSNTSSLPEVVGDAALTVNPADQAALTEALRQLLTDAKLRQRLAIAGKARSRQFSWENAAKETLRVLERTAQRSA